MITLILVFGLWLPLATTLFAVVNGSIKDDFDNFFKKVLYYVLAAPAYYTHWLTAAVTRNDKSIARLEKLGEWFRN